MCEDVSEDPITSTQNLLKNRVKKFGDCIEVYSRDSTKLGDIVCVKELAEESIKLAYDYSHSAEATLRKAALLLRQSIKDVTKTSLSDRPCLNDFEEGEASPPDLLLTFYQVLFGRGKSNEV